eukprot:435631_1
MAAANAKKSTKSTDIIFTSYLKMTRDEFENYQRGQKDIGNIFTNFKVKLESMGIKIAKRKGTTLNMAMWDFLKCYPKFYHYLSTNVASDIGKAMLADSVTRNIFASRMFGCKTENKSEKMKNKTEIVHTHRASEKTKYQIDMVKAQRIEIVISDFWRPKTGKPNRTIEKILDKYESDTDSESESESETEENKNDNGNDEQVITKEKK